MCRLSFHISYTEFGLNTVRADGMALFRANASAEKGDDQSARIILGMGSANERMCYIGTHGHIDWAHTQNNPVWVKLFYIWG